jgi:glycosyltransferase involved in cell wall biosynthesis
MAEAAKYVNPEDVLDIEQAIAYMLKDGVYRNNLKRAGLERAKQFDWENCARETLEFYHQVGQGRRKVKDG